MKLFLKGFSKNTQTLYFMKICPVGAELYREDGQTGGQTDKQTDRHNEASSRSSQFCERA